MPIPTPDSLTASLAERTSGDDLPKEVTDALAAGLQATVEDGKTVTVFNLSNHPYSTVKREDIQNALERARWMTNYFADTKTLHVYPR